MFGPEVSEDDFGGYCSKARSMQGRIALASQSSAGLGFQGGQDLGAFSPRPIVTKQTPTRPRG